MLVQCYNIITQVLLLYWQLPIISLIPLLFKCIVLTQNCMAVPCTYIIIKVTGKYHVIIFTTKAIFEVVNIHELLPHCNTKYLYQIQIFIQLQVLYTEGCNISTTCIEMQSHQIYFFFKLLFLKCILAECVGSGLLCMYYFGKEDLRVLCVVNRTSQIFVFACIECISSNFMSSILVQLLWLLVCTVLAQCLWV